MRLTFPDCSLLLLSRGFLDHFAAETTSISRLAGR